MVSFAFAASPSERFGGVICSAFFLAMSPVTMAVMSRTSATMPNPAQVGRPIATKT